MVGVKLQDPELTVYLNWGCGMPEMRGSFGGNDGK